MEELRTPKQKCRLLNDGIDILQTDVAEADAFRLKTGRIKANRNLELEILQTQLNELEGSATEQKLLTEFLVSDIRMLQSQLHDLERQARLSGVSSERVSKIQETLQVKLIELTDMRDREFRNKSNLEVVMAHYETETSKFFLPEHNEVKDTKRLSPSRNKDGGGGGDDIDDIHKETNLVHVREELRKLTNYYEDTCGQRESLEQETKFMEEKLQSIRTQVETSDHQFKLIDIELSVKQRQLGKARARAAEDTLTISQKRAELERMQSLCGQADKSHLQAIETARILKTILKRKLNERRELELILTREAEVQALKDFSQRLSYQNIDEQYSGLNSETTQFLKEVVRGSSQDLSRCPDWTNEIDNLIPDFKDSATEVSSELPLPSTAHEPKLGHVVDSHRNGYTPSSMHSICLPPSRYQSSPQYHQPVLQLKKWTAKVSQHDDQAGVRRRKKRTSPLSASQSEPCRSTLSKTTFFRNLFLRLGSILVSGASKYPKILVVNGVMYRFQDRINPPEPISGPLPLGIWRRHFCSVGEH